MNMMNLVYAVPAVGIVAIIYMIIRSSWINKQDAGDARMQTIAQYIQKGAMSFLTAEYRILTIFVIITSILLFFLSYGNENSSPLIVVAFIIGAVFSASAGCLITA